MGFETILGLVQLASNKDVRALVSGAVNFVAEYVTPYIAIPEPILESGEIEFTDARNRLSAGLTKRDGQVVVALLVEKLASTAERRAENLAVLGGDSVVHIVTGFASSSRAPPVSTQSNRAGLGASVSHLNGFAGTVGCLVQVQPKDGLDYLGFTSAAHVLSMLNAADKEDIIISPGNPDGPAIKSNEIGKLQDFAFLKHHSVEQQWGNLINHEDIAVVRLKNDAKGWDEGNFVKQPTGSGRKRVKEVVKADELLDYLGRPVFKHGRTTDHTAGTLEIVAIEQFPIKLPNGKNYLYKDLIGIKSSNAEPFSGPGDSGGLVYTDDYKAIGFVVGGSDTYTFACLAERSLDYVNAKLL